MVQILADEFVDGGGTQDVLWLLTDRQNTVRDQIAYSDRMGPGNTFVAGARKNSARERKPI